MKRLDGKKVGTGLAVAAGLYLLWGLFSGGFDGADAPALEEGTTEPPPGYMGGLEDTPIAAPMPQPLPMPEPQPEPPPVAQAAPVAQQSAAHVGQAMSPPATAMPTTGMPASSGILEWFGKLSPSAQQTLAQGVAGGAAGLMSALAQRNAQKDAEDQRDEAREDRNRRSSIPDISGGFIARTKGA